MPGHARKPHFQSRRFEVKTRLRKSTLHRSGGNAQLKGVDARRPFVWRAGDQRRRGRHTGDEHSGSANRGIFTICCDLTRPTITRLARTFQQGRAVAANGTFRWSHFAYAISWRTSSSVCASLISDRHSEQKRRATIPRAAAGIAAAFQRAFIGRTKIWPG